MKYLSEMKTASKWKSWDLNSMWLRGGSSDLYIAWTPLSQRVATPIT